MSEWAPRRFWKDASVGPDRGGWTVLLDGRPVRTPARRAFAVPTRALAEAAAAEWTAQGERIAPASMPVTRAANSAIDKVAPQRDAVAQALAAYAGTDLLCHRADTPKALAQLQAVSWDPLLDWAAETLGARLLPVVGVMPRAQPPGSLDRFARRVDALDAFNLAGMHELVSLSGSLVLAFAVLYERLAAEAAWDLSCLDEEWQAQLWGYDAEADAAAERRRAAFLEADRFLRLARM